MILCRVFQESISVTMRGILRAGSLLRYEDISGQNLCYYEGYFRTGSMLPLGVYFTVGPMLLQGGYFRAGSVLLGGRGPGQKVMVSV